MSYTEEPRLLQTLFPLFQVDYLHDIMIIICSLVKLNKIATPTGIKNKSPGCFFLKIFVIFFPFQILVLTFPYHF